MTTNSDCFKRAKQHISGGVNSSARAFKGVGGTPPFFRSAKGAYIYDVEGTKYIDYIGSWGPMILGHGDERVVSAVCEQVKKAMSFGAPTEVETELAEKVCELMPNIEKVRFVNSGTEVTMVAIRLARGATGRNKIVKFEGCYHGHADSLLVKAGSAALTLGVPSSPGVPADTTKDTLTASFNDFDQITKMFEREGDEIACIILEPITGNMNFVRPAAGYLQHLRDLCTKHGALLVIDEVMTGFRVALGGAQSLYNIKPDLTCLGKVIGGGMPVGALGGRADLMDQLTPDGSIFQSGTLSGNPVSMTSGLATLNAISEPGFYEELTHKTALLIHGLQSAADELNIPFYTDFEGGMFGFFFTDQKAVNSFDDVMRCDITRFKEFFHFMLDRGIYLACSMYEAGFISMAHSDADIQKTIDVASAFFRQLPEAQKQKVPHAETTAN